MKKGILLILLSTVLVFGAFAQNYTSLTITNETGYTINYLYFSPSAYDDWGDDFLGGEDLVDGESVEVELNRDFDEAEGLYDLQAVDEDGDYYTIYETDIAAGEPIVVTMENYDGGDYGDDYSDDYSGYDEGYNDGYSEGYKAGYTEAFRDAYLEGFKAAREMEPASDSWR